MKRLTDVCGDGAHVAPVEAIRNLETIILREECVFLVAIRLLQRYFALLLMNVRNALEEEQRKDVGLEVCSVHWTAQDVRGFPQVRFQLRNRNGGHRGR